MLNGTYGNITSLDYSATLSANYVLSESVYRRGSLQIRTLKLISVVVGSRAKLCIYHHTGVQSFAMYAEWGFKSYLFHFDEIRDYEWLIIILFQVWTPA